MAIPGGGIALRGWVSDPHGEIAGLWLEIDGMLRPANIAVRMYRKDVLEQRRLLEAFPGLRTGCYVFEACDVQPGHETVVNLHAITQTPGGFVVLSSGTTVVPGHHCSVDRLTNEFQAGFAEASAISAAARPFLTGLASTQRQIVWRGRQLESASEVPADLAVVVVVKDNVDMIYHLLATLEACRSAEKMEVILSLQSPGIEREVDQYVNSLRGGTFFASINTLVPVLPIGFGQAASGGVAFARSAAVALASDEILPPNADWAGTALELLAKDPQGVLIPAIATFDHRPFTFDSVFAPAWAEFAHDHSGLADVAGLTPVRKATAWSSGYLVANRDTLAAAGGLDDSLSDMEICLLELVLRIQFDGTARLQHLPGAFTHLRLPPYTASDRVQRLWSLYALAENIRHRLGGAAQ